MRVSVTYNTNQQVLLWLVKWKKGQIDSFQTRIVTLRPNDANIKIGKYLSRSSFLHGVLGD